MLGFNNTPHVAQPPVVFGAVVGNLWSLPVVALANNAAREQQEMKINGTQCWGPRTHITCFRGFPLNCSPHSFTAS